MIDRPPNIKDKLHSAMVLECENRAHPAALRALADCLNDMTGEDRLELVRRWSAAARECKAAREHQPSPAAQVFQTRHVVDEAETRSSAFDVRALVTRQMREHLMERALGEIMPDRWYMVRIGSPLTRPSEQTRYSGGYDREMVMRLEIDPRVA